MLSTAAVADLQDESTNSAVLVQRLVALSNSPTSAPNNSSCNHNDDDRDDDVGLAALDENEPPKNGDGKKAAAEIRIGPATKRPRPTRRPTTSSTTRTSWPAPSRCCATSHANG